MKQKFSIAMSLAVILAMLLTSLALAGNARNDVTPAADDTTPPVITPIEVGWMGENGWYRSEVTVSWSVVDDESPISSTSGCDPTTIPPDTAGTTLTCSATSAGGTSSESVTIRIDITPPTIYGSRSPAANEYDWNNTAVTVTFTCEDWASGVMYCEGDWFFSDEGAGQGVGLARAVDWAWNDERYVYGANIDKTPPIVSLVGGPANGGTYYSGFVPAAPTCSASDALSGLDGSCSVTGYSTAVGSHKVTASATDKASNSASASASYTVLPSLSDTTPPVITPIFWGGWGENGWFVTDVTVTWSVVDGESPISSTSGCDPTTIFADNPGTTLMCSATSAGGTSSESVTIRVDATLPDIYGSASPPPNSFGWNNTDVTVSFICSDGMSGINYCERDHVLSEEGAGQGVYGRAVDWAWNYGNGGVWGINIDKTAPTVSLVGGPANGANYYFGAVPAAPACSASDVLSGLDGSCSVNGYSTAVGSHTLTASATDKAGNSASASATYTVLPWSLAGFYPPVDMNGVYNLVRSGSPVPLKFEVFAGPTELSDTSVVQSLTSALVACPAGTGDAPGKTASAGDGTPLRYDKATGQFIYNWQTPRQPGACYRVTMMTRDGSSLVAFFRLR